MGQAGHWQKIRVPAPAGADGRAGPCGRSRSRSWRRSRRVLGSEPGCARLRKTLGVLGGWKASWASWPAGGGVRGSASTPKGRPSVATGSASALTAESSRWAGAITRASEEAGSSPTGT